MKDLVAHWCKLAQPGFSYDATSILGFDEASPIRLPDAGPGEIILRYGGWSLAELVTIARSFGVRIMIHNSLDQYTEWFRQSLPAGIYRLRLPVLPSKGLALPEQEKFLIVKEGIAPTVLTATTMIVYKMHTGHWPSSGLLRCKERLSSQSGYILYLLLNDQLTLYHQLDQKVEADSYIVSAELLQSE